MLAVLPCDLGGRLRGAPTGDDTRKVRLVDRRVGEEAGKARVRMPGPSERRLVVVVRERPFPLSWGVPDARPLPMEGARATVLWGSHPGFAGRRALHRVPDGAGQRASLFFQKRICIRTRTRVAASAWRSPNGASGSFSVGPMLQWESELENSPSTAGKGIDTRVSILWPAGPRPESWVTTSLSADKGTALRRRV